MSVCIYIYLSMGLCGLSVERETLGWCFILILAVLLLICGWKGCYFTRVRRKKVHLWNNSMLFTYLGGSALLALWPARLFAWPQLFNACSKLTSTSQRALQRGEDSGRCRTAKQCRGGWIFVTSASCPPSTFPFEHLGAGIAEQLTASACGCEEQDQWLSACWSVAEIWDLWGDGAGRGNLAVPAKSRSTPWTWAPASPCLQQSSQKTFVSHFSLGIPGNSHLYQVSWSCLMLV